jgi:thiamine pyrophosphokinase
VFSAGERAEGVTLKGLKYPLEDATLTCDYPLGVSNEFAGGPAEVTVRDGTLLIAWTGGFGVES